MEKNSTEKKKLTWCGLTNESIQINTFFYAEEESVRKHNGIKIPLIMATKDITSMSRPKICAGPK